MKSNVLSATPPKVSAKSLTPPGLFKTEAITPDVAANQPQIVESLDTHEVTSQIEAAPTPVATVDQPKPHAIVQTPKAAAESLANPVPLDPASFPNQPRPGCSQLPSTIANVEHLLSGYGISARYDAIKKRVGVRVPGQEGSPDNADNVALTHIQSLASLNGLPLGQLPEYVATIADRNQTNPAADWIKGKPWDGIDRFLSFCATLTLREDFPKDFAATLLKRWLISAVAAALKPIGFKTRGVLTLQGPQSIGKTTWIKNLVSHPIYQEMLIKLDHHLDAGNKDSILTAISHWIVEVGELDSSFKKDIARLKGFLTNDKDKMRRPYGRVDSEYQRRTVFCATVNEETFLVDPTGNSRWLTIPVTAIDHNHGIDMQQLFAQMAVEFENGTQWWLTKEEEATLESCNKLHRSVSAIGERILDAIDLSKVGEPNLAAFTPTKFLIRLGIRNPTNQQAKECGAILREYLGESKRVNGSNVWRIPMRAIQVSANLDIED